MSQPSGPRGPEFTRPPQPARPPGATPPLTRQPTAAAGPPPDRPGGRSHRLATALTLAAIALVAAIVVVATVLAGRDDVRLATPSPAPSQPGATIATDRIEFTTAGGSGTLRIVDHGWDSDGTDPDQPGSLLTVVIEVTCERGVVDYGPDTFQAFDRNGELFEPEVLPDSPTALEIGTLAAGQSVRGTVAFEIPRGGVTLLMSDPSAQAVTALKVPD